MKVKKLLLVGDDTIELSELGHELSNEGYVVLTVNTVEQACQLAQTETGISLAIVDIGIPYMSGLETVKTLKSFGIPVIFLLSDTKNEYVKVIVESGVLAYLVKPITIAQSIPVIELSIKTGQEIQGLLDIKERLDSALETGHHVNVAIGILMERHKLKREQAFELLRQEARSNRKKVKDIAIEFIDAWYSIHLITSPNLQP